MKEGYFVSERKSLVLVMCERPPKLAQCQLRLESKFAPGTVFRMEHRVYCIFGPQLGQDKIIRYTIH